MNPLRPIICVGLLAVALARAQSGPTMPINGPFLADMDRVDSTMTTLMTKYGSPGGQLAVTRNGRLVLARGYGYADQAAAQAVQPDALFRIASLSKFITATAVLTLVEQGKLDLDAKAFALVPQLTPLPGATRDPRLADITVRQLLQHTGGWDRDVSGDPMFNSTGIANAAGTSVPASAELVIRYMLGRPLDFDPGSRYAYSNFGYNVLGRVIERVSGQTYNAFVQSALFGRIGVTRAVLGRSLLADRAAGEVRYYDYPNAPLAFSVFPPTSAIVPWPYGGFHLEAMDSHGEWAMSAIDYVRLFAAVDGSRAPALLNATSIAALTARPAPPVSVGAAAYYGAGLLIRPINNTGGLGANWWHDGSLPGTVTYAVRLSNGWSWAAFFNTRPVASSAFASEIDTSINTALGALTPPAGDLLDTAKPQIVTPPAAQAVTAGATATLTATVTSVNPLTYQWFKDGVALPGATNATLTLPNVTAASAGTYHVVVSNLNGSATSAAASLSIAPASEAGRLINLSILTPLASGETLTLGTAIGGSGTSGSKPLLVRAVGPSLTPLGVPGAHTDPKLDLFSGQTIIATNDNWGGVPSLATAFANVGAFAYASTGSRDAAVLPSPLAIGNYTVQVTGVGSTAGVVLAELYDSTPTAAFVATTPRLINLSVLKRINAGGTLTAGFAIGGATPKQLLLRVVGPTLAGAPFSISGTMANPKLDLFREQTVINSNDNWGGGATLASAFANVGAFALGATSLDAALLVTLAPGNYTAQASGVAGTGGLVLMEVYEVP